MKAIKIALVILGIRVTALVDASQRTTGYSGVMENVAVRGIEARRHLGELG